MEAWGIDYLALSGHKVYAPFGTGVLVARKGLLQFSLDELQRIQQSGEETRAALPRWVRRWCCCGRSGWK